MKLSKSERRFVNLARVARVATVDGSGRPHNVPICPLLDGDRIYFATEASAKKAQNLAGRPHAAIAFDDYTEDWNFLRGVLVIGEARVVKAAEFRRLRKKLYAKYPAYPELAPLEEGESIILEVTPRRKASWGFR